MGRNRNNRRSKSKSKYNQKNKKEHEKPFKRNPLADQWQPDCPICGKTVRNLNIAIEEKVSKEPAHFECVMQSIAAETSLGPGERLHYLGSGNFGVVKFAEGKGLSSYTILRRIPYEDRDNKSEWRKKIHKYVE